MTAQNGRTGRYGGLLRRWYAEWIGNPAPQWMLGPTEEQMQQEMETLSDELESQNEDFKGVLIFGSLAAWLTAVCGSAWVLSSVVVAAGAVFNDVIVTGVYLATVFIFAWVLQLLRMLFDNAGRAQGQHGHRESTTEELERE